MRPVKKLIALVLVLLTLNLYFPGTAFADKPLTNHPPETVSTPEEDIPMKVVKKKSKWPWVLLGVLVVGGVAAAGGSGGSGDDGGGGGGDGDEGDVTVTW